MNITIETQTQLTATAMAENKMEVRDVNVHYGKFQALADINMTIAANRITAIIGPSGCGKSTLLRSFNRMNDLVGNARVDGQILLDGADINAAGVDVVDVRRRVGMVFQRRTRSRNPSTTTWPTVRACMASAAKVTWMTSWRNPSSRPPCGMKSRTNFTKVGFPFRADNNSVCASPAPWPWNPRSS